MPDKGPVQPNRGAPIPAITGGGDSSGSYSNSLSVLAKVGAAAFGTIIAPILVAFVMKYLDPPVPPAAQPVTEPAGPKVEAVIALPAATPTTPPVVASNAPPVSSSAAPAVSTARIPAAPSTPAVSPHLPVQNQASPSRISPRPVRP